MFLFVPFAEIPMTTYTLEISINATHSTTEIDFCNSDYQVFLDPFTFLDWRIQQTQESKERRERGRGGKERRKEGT